ncbi:MAG: FIST C-terminal domain-containing protein [Bacteroidia bacterium]|nr:FIST C-terminal domain-containing protein [Bacteroidia bacterium]
MLQFFSASTNIVNSKRAITECLENALEGKGSLDCDLIIIYSAMGHNFKDLLSEARKLSPGARIAGCTGGGIIGRKGPDESMAALAIMSIKGPKNEFALTNRKTFAGNNTYELAAGMARELKGWNQNISFVLFLPNAFECFPMDRAISGIESVFGSDVPVFGGVSMDNFKAISSFHFFDDEVVERGAVMIGFADPTLKFISDVNHGFVVIEGLSLEVTKSELNIIHEFNGKPAWNVLAKTLGIPDTSSFLEAGAIAGFARELPEELQEEYGNKYYINGLSGKYDDNSISVGDVCPKGTKLRLTKRDEKSMFEGVDWMINRVVGKMQGIKPLAVFHSDCILRGRYSLNRILKDELIHRMQSPICKGENIPWLGLYSGGEICRIGSRNWFHTFSSSLFVIYR